MHQTLDHQDGKILVGDFNIHDQNIADLNSKQITWKYENCFPMGSGGGDSASGATSEREGPTNDETMGRERHNKADNNRPMDSIRLISNSEKMFDLEKNIEEIYKNILPESSFFKFFQNRQNIFM